MKTSSKRRGFTLVEVLAAMVLMGIVLPVAMRGVSLAVAAAGHARHLSEASSLAETKLNELLVVDAPSAAGTSGDFAPDHPEYQWKCDSQQRDYNMTEFVLTVSWQEQGQPRTFALSTMIYEPTQSEGLQ